MSFAITLNKPGCLPDNADELAVYADLASARVALLDELAVTCESATDDGEDTAGYAEARELATRVGPCEPVLFAGYVHTIEPVKPKVITAYFARRHLCTLGSLHWVLHNDYAATLPPELFTHLAEAERILTEVFNAAPGRDQLYPKGT